MSKKTQPANPYDHFDELSEFSSDVLRKELERRKEEEKELADSERLNQLSDSITIEDLAWFFNEFCIDTCLDEELKRYRDMEPIVWAMAEEGLEARRSGK